MDRIVYRLRAGALSNMKPEKDTLPPPQPQEVCVEVHAIGLNFADVFAIWGLYGATPKGIFTPGLEYAGIVRRTGTAVTQVRPGDRVMGVTRFGAYATHLNIDERYVVPIPDGWSFSQGASFLVQALTAYYGLTRLGDLKPGQTVLIHSAAGGVGLFAGRIAHSLGCHTIGTVGNEAKAAFLRETEHYDSIIVRNPKCFGTDLDAALGGRPLHVIMECIGGTIFTQGFKRLAPQGRHIVYGAARYATTGNRPNYLRLFWLYLTRPKIDPQKLPEINKSVMGFNLIYLYEQAPLMHQLLKELATLDLSPPHVGHRLPFDRLPDAILLFQSGKTIGKVVVEVPQQSGT